MPAITSFAMLIALLPMAAPSIVASPITTPYLQAVSAPTCPTTVDTFPVPNFGPTSTVYTSTLTTTKEYDCHGCDSLVIVQLGHIFPDVPVNYTATVTESTPTTFIEALCATSASAVVAASTPVATVTTTSTASLTTITIGGESDFGGFCNDNNLEDRIACLPHALPPFPGLPQTTSISQRSEDFGGSFQPARCINTLTGQPISGCTTRRDAGEIEQHLVRLYPLKRRDNIDDVSREDDDVGEEHKKKICHWKGLESVCPW